MLTAQEVDRLGRNLLDGLIVLDDPFQRGIAVKVPEGTPSVRCPSAGPGRSGGRAGPG
ncbi:hypothetical protein [Nonomuraea sp. NPDC005650]|uniref:hypothetical protein n=1 Tax=Nonomuraea sp. NPDC005650 TaxID=3157045 RepID=UPI0033B13054